MPRIRWSGLPPALRDHLFDDARTVLVVADVALGALVLEKAEAKNAGQTLDV